MSTSVNKEVVEDVPLRAASRFVGEFAGKIDSKGRVSIPADLRRFIDVKASDPSPVIYCCPSFIDAELMCGGPDLVDTILWIVGGGDLFEKNRTALETAVTQHTQRLYFDENGRVVIPKKFRDHAQLSGEIQVAGRGAYFSLSEKAVIDSLTAVLSLLSDEEKDILRARALPSTLGSKDLRGQS